MLRKRSLREETDGPGEDKETARCEESEAHCAPSSLPRLDGRQLAAEKQAFSENLGPEVSMTAKLLNCVFEFRPLHLIVKENIYVDAHVWVFYTTSSVIDKEIILRFLVYCIPLSQRLHQV